MMNLRIGYELEMPSPSDCVDNDPDIDITGGFVSGEFPPVLQVPETVSSGRFIAEFQSSGNGTNYDSTRAIAGAVPYEDFSIPDMLSKTWRRGVSVVEGPPHSGKTDFGRLIMDRLNGQYGETDRVFIDCIMPQEIQRSDIEVQVGWLQLLQSRLEQMKKGQISVIDHVDKLIPEGDSEIDIAKLDFLSSIFDAIVNKQSDGVILLTNGNLRAWLEHQPEISGTYIMGPFKEGKYLLFGHEQSQGLDNQTEPGHGRERRELTSHEMPTLSEKDKPSSLLDVIYGRALEAHRDKALSTILCQPNL